MNIEIPGIIEAYPKAIAQFYRAIADAVDTGAECHKDLLSKLETRAVDVDAEAEGQDQDIPGQHTMDFDSSPSEPKQEAADNGETPDPDAETRQEQDAVEPQKSPDKPAPKKRGRPKGSKNKAMDKAEEPAEEPAEKLEEKLEEKKQAPPEEKEKEKGESKKEGPQGNIAGCKKSGAAFAELYKSSGTGNWAKAVGDLIEANSAQGVRSLTALEEKPEFHSAVAEAFDQALVDLQTDRGEEGESDDDLGL